MKNLIFLFLSVLFLFGCKKEEPETSTVPPPSLSIFQIVTEGDWKISYFMDNNVDETAQFDGYVFTFQSGYIRISGGNISTPEPHGTYVDVNIAEKDPLLMIILFSEIEPWKDLTREWIVKERSEEIMKLEEQKETGEWAYLHFTRN
jgi:hypothetical protein